MDGQTYGSISKFFNEQSDLHRGVLSWPGTLGLPFRGNGKPPVLSRDNFNRLYVTGDACHGTFDLSKKEDSELYCWVRDRIRNGWFILDDIERHWDPEKKNMIIYMEWTQLSVQMHQPNQQ